MAANKAGPGAIGLNLLNFSRVRIQHYVPTPNFTSRAELPRSWQDATNEPLVWKVTEPEAVVAPPEPLLDEAPVQEKKQEGFPQDLVKILAMHEAQQAVAPPAEMPAETPRPQLVPKPTPQAPSKQQTPARPQAVQRQPALPTAAPQTLPRPAAQRPPDKAKPGLMEEVTPKQIDTVEDSPLPEFESWDTENVAPEETLVVPLDPEPEILSEEAPLDVGDGWLPTHPIPAAEMPPVVQAKPAPEQPEIVQRMAETTAPASQPQIVQRTPEAVPSQPEIVQRTAEPSVAPPPPERAKPQPPREQSPLLSAIVGNQPEPAPSVPANFSLPLLEDDEEFAKDTERVEYVSPDDDSSIMMSTTEARVSRLDVIQRNLESVQRNLDSIQRFVGAPEERSAQAEDSPVVEDAVEEADFSDYQPDAAPALWHNPEQPYTPPAQPPTVQRAEVDAPSAKPAVLRSAPKMASPPNQPPANGDSPMSEAAPYDLPMTEPELPEDSDLVIALQAADTAMPVASEMRDFEPRVWATQEPVQDGWKVISRKPETPANGVSAHDDSPVANHTASAPDSSDGSPETHDPVTADLLTLLNLPPDTPIIGRESSNTAIQRSTNGGYYSSDEDDAPLNPINEVPLDVALMGGGMEQPVMRVEEAAPTNGGSGTNGGNGNGHHNDYNQGASGASVDVPENESDKKSEGPNIDKLARDVHRLLRERLRIENDRRTDR